MKLFNLIKRIVINLILLWLIVRLCIRYFTTNHDIGTNVDCNEYWYWTIVYNWKYDIVVVSWTYYDYELPLKDMEVTWLFASYRRDCLPFIERKYEHIATKFRCNATQGSSEECLGEWWIVD